MSHVVKLPRGIRPPWKRHSTGKPDDNRTWWQRPGPGRAYRQRTLRLIPNDPPGPPPYVQPEPAGTSPARTVRVVEPPPESEAAA